MDIDLTQFDKEIQAGYISPDFEVYSNVPDYIKKMAKGLNTEYQKFFNTDFFKFIDEECFMPADNLPPIPDFMEQARKELELKYKE